jgi:RHS repeat-associated protein
MGEKRGRALVVILAAVLGLGIAAPASASFTTRTSTTAPPLSLPPAAQLAAAPTLAAPPFAASVEPPSPSPGMGLSASRTPTGPRSYFGARYYQAKLARFTTVDPVYTWRENLVDPQRWNRYAYARNNPLKYTDPDGRAINLVGGGIGAGIGGVAGFIGYAVALHVRGGPFVLQDALAATGGGAVSGGLAGLTMGGSLLATAAVGAGTNVVGGAVQRAADSDPNTRVMDVKQAGLDAATGGIAGGIGWGAKSVMREGVQQLEKTEAGMRAAARRGGAGAYSASHGADGVAARRAAQESTAEVTAMVAGAKTTNVVTPVARAVNEKQQQ